MRHLLKLALSNINRVRFSSKFHQSLTRNYTTNSIDQCKVCAIPALMDNYMYVLIDKKSGIAAAVDPVEPEKILKCVKDENADLTTVLTTHHHFDHAGGNEEICEKVKNLTVYGGDDRIECLTSKLSHGSLFQVGNLIIKCLETPCHTSGHVCYYIQLAGIDPICFTGDTMFIAGCGRFFEGTAEQMFNSLEVLKSLPVNTKIYCGHEYTINNLKFAVSVEPHNNYTKDKLKSCVEKLSRGEPTVPSTIGEELTYNPFLRVSEKAVQLYTKAKDPIAVMAELRKMKDNFKA